MKTNLKTTGKVELTEKEVFDAIKEFTIKNKQLKPAIDEYLAAKLNVTTKRIQYSGSGVVLAEVETQVGTDPIKLIGDTKMVDKEAATGFKRENVGVFKAIKAFLAEEKKKNSDRVTYVHYDKVWGHIKKEYPKLDERKFTIYIRDTRQLKNTKYDSKSKMIKVG